MERFSGLCDLFHRVDASDAVGWIQSIAFEEWPQQRKSEDGQVRPSMVTDLSWHGFGDVVAPIVKELMSFASGTPDQLMLSVVMPGQSIPSHYDNQPDNWVARVHVPLTTNKKAVYLGEGKPFHMKVGKSYLINTTRLHGIENNGKIPRIHFMFDIRR